MIPSQVRISPTYQAIHQENLLRRPPAMKSVIFRLPEQSPPNLEGQQSRFRQMYSARLVSNDDDDDDAADQRPGDGLSKEIQQIDFTSPEASIKSVFFSPIEPAATPSSSNTPRDVFFTPELASPTLIDDIQSSRSIATLQKLKVAFGTEYPSLSRRTEARIHDLIVNSPSSVLVGEDLIASPGIHSLSTSVITLGMSLSTEEEGALVMDQQHRTETIRPAQSVHFESTPQWPSATKQTILTKAGDALELVSPLPNNTFEYQELLQSVEDLRAHNHTLQSELQEQVTARTKSVQTAHDKERHLQSQIQTLQESLGAASHQTEKERVFFLQVQENLNRRLKRAKERLQEVSHQREAMVSNLRHIVAEDDGANLNVDELIQKAANSMKEHETANIELAKALEAAQKEIRTAKEGKNKSEQLLTVATNQSRKLELENKQLLSQLKTLSNELNETRHKFDEAIDAQKQQQLKQWQEQEKQYMDIIHGLRQNIRDQENTVSMDLYRHAVAESKRHAEQCQYYQQRAKTSSERVHSLERLVMARNDVQPTTLNTTRVPPKPPATKIADPCPTKLSTNAPPKPPATKTAGPCNAPSDPNGIRAGKVVPPPPPTGFLAATNPKQHKVPPPPPPKTVPIQISNGEPTAKEKNVVRLKKSYVEGQKNDSIVQKKSAPLVEKATNHLFQPHIPKQVRFKVSHSPRHLSRGWAVREVTPPLPNKAPPEPLIRLQPSKENSWITPSRSSSSNLRHSLVRAAGGRLKLQSLLRELRQPLKDSVAN